MELAKAFTSILVAASVAAAPVAAQAATGIDEARTASEVEAENLGRGFTIPLIILIAIVVGALIVVASGDDDPVSP